MQKPSSTVWSEGLRTVPNQEVNIVNTVNFENEKGKIL